jgi:hypothetical protein
MTPFVNGFVEGLHREEDVFNGVASPIVACDSQLAVTLFWLAAIRCFEHVDERFARRTPIG